MLNTILSLLAVGALWGVTNPFIRLSSKGIERVQTNSKWQNIFVELRMVLTRLDYWMPFLLNQAGSVLYVWTLQNANITIAVPIANSLSFAFTAITGYMLGEQLPARNILFGTLLVFTGSTMILYDKLWHETNVASLS